MGRTHRWSEDLEYVNEHREAVGRAKLRMPKRHKTLSSHLKLIEDKAPYGEDPWGKDGEVPFDGVL